MEFRFFDTPELKVASSIQTNNKCNFIATFSLYPTFQANYHFPCRFMNWDSTLTYILSLSRQRVAENMLVKLPVTGKNPRANSKDITTF